MKIQKSISTGLLYLTKISSFLTLLSPIVTKATVVKNPSKSVKSLIALFNNGVTSTTVTKSPLGNLGNVNVQSSINKLTLSDFDSNTTTTKTPLRNNLGNLSARSSIVSLNSISSNTSSISSSKETLPNVSVGSIVSRFEAVIKNSNQTTSPQKSKTPIIKKYSTSEVLKLSNEVLNKQGFLDGFNKTNKSLPKLKSPLSGNNLDKNLKTLQERKRYLNSVLVGSMASRGMIFEKETAPQQTKKDPYSNISPFMRSLLISKGMIHGENNNQQ